MFLSRGNLGYRHHPPLLLRSILLVSPLHLPSQICLPIYQTALAFVSQPNLLLHEVADAFFFQNEWMFSLLLMLVTNKQNWILPWAEVHILAY